VGGVPPPTGPPPPTLSATQPPVDKDPAQLLDSIRKGKQLKKVTEAPKLNDLSPEAENSIAGALRSALLQREKFIQDSDSEPESTPNNEEWD